MNRIATLAFAVLAACDSGASMPDAADAAKDAPARPDAESMDAQPPDGPESGAGVHDAGMNDAGVHDAGVQNDAGLMDGGVVQDAAMDASSDGGADAGQDAGPMCGVGLDADVLALWSMNDLEDGSELDETGDHTMTVEGSLPTTGGPPYCDSALVGGSGGYGVVPDSEEWQLYDASIDMYVRLPSPPSSSTSNNGTEQGLLSRDAEGRTDAGHFGLFYIETGGLVARLQVNQNHFICAEGPLPTGEWIHVGINLGTEVELWIDGQQSTYTGTIPWKATDVTCETGVSGSIQGNNNPWVIGAHSEESSEGSATPVDGHFPGTLDEIRISNVRRDFSSFAE